MTKQTTETHKAPGRHYRKGMTLAELFAKFPNDAAAEAWFAEVRWAGKPECPHCGHDSIQHPTTHPTMPYRCRGCRRFFSVRTDSVMADSKLGYQTWAIAVYLFNTGIKGTSAMKFHRDLGTAYSTAWHLAHRIRKAYDTRTREADPFLGPVEADETAVGQKARTMHAAKRRERIHGRGMVDKTIVAGVKDRNSGQVAATVVERTDRATLQGFVRSHSGEDAMVYTDDHGAYIGLPHHATVRHSVGEYVDGMAHVNGIESFWALMKRGLHGTYHQVSPKHLDRYVQEFAGRHNTRPLDTDKQMEHTAANMVGKRLQYAELVAEPV
ncbi:MAG: IS1595 family transposase [Acidimicrobiaceae bacterium]|nr:IS1595 family transposase [Acidimicrobiaceae bacterium]